MFLVEDHRPGTTYLVFTWEDPRKDGYRGDVIDGVSLDYDMEAVHSWPDGHARPEACLGQAGDNPKHYKVFKYRSELQSAGYDPVPGTVVVVGFWSDYRKVNPAPEELQNVDEEEWYERLDEYDEAARRRRQGDQEPAAPLSCGRDDVAAWVAKEHRIADSSIREVWYLPQAAPPDEIRLLELSDRIAGPDATAEPFDFGLNVEGARFHLLVADVTSEQLERIKQDPSHLPAGWSLQGAAIWRRGA